MIPKKVHYIWLGGKPLSKLSEICINSWRRNLPDFEINRWDETNLPIEKYAKECKFFAECYRRKIWAFVSDYIRLRVLYDDGGIYMDTDIEVVQDFSPLLNRDFLIGYEKDNYICTGVIGAEPHSSKIKKIIDFYNTDIWNVDYFNNPIIFRKVIEDNPKLFSNVEIMSKNTFCPYNPGENQVNKQLIDRPNTYAIHWYSADWGFSKEAYVFLQTKQYKGIEKNFQIVKKSFGYYKNRRKWNVK